MPNRFLVDPLNRSGTSACLCCRHPIVQSGVHFVSFRAFNRTVLVASEANIYGKGVTRHGPPHSKPSLQTYGRDTHHRPIATARDPPLPSRRARQKARENPPGPPPSTSSSLPSRAAVAGSRGDAPPRARVTLRRVVSIDTRYVTATRWMRLCILARLVVVVSRASRRLGWVRETDRIASRTARPDEICASTRHVDVGLDDDVGHDDDGVAWRKYIARAASSRRHVVGRARRAGRGRCRWMMDASR